MKLFLIFCGITGLSVLVNMASGNTWGTHAFGVVLCFGMFIGLCLAPILSDLMEGK